MKKFIFKFQLFGFLVSALLLGSGANGALPLGACEKSRPLKTPFGELTKTECGTAKSGYSEFIKLNDAVVLSDVRLFDEDSNKSWTKWVYTSGAIDNGTACPKKLYLVDVGVNPVKVFAFGVRGACNQFDWASWGEKRSVIAIKKNVRFVYENGQLKAPAKTEKMWLSVEPPHTGGGLSEENAIPFVEEVPLPK